MTGDGVAFAASHRRSGSFRRTDRQTAFEGADISAARILSVLVFYIILFLQHITQPQGPRAPGSLFPVADQRLQLAAVAHARAAFFPNARTVCPICSAAVPASQTEVCAPAPGNTAGKGTARSSTARSARCSSRAARAQIGKCRRRERRTAAPTPPNARLGLRSPRTKYDCGVPLGAAPPTFSAGR